MTALIDSSVPTKVLFIDHFFRFLFYFFPFIIDNCNYGSLFFQKVYKNEDFLLFTIIYPEINMNVVKTICLGNNLSKYIRENIDFPRQKPRQLPSAEANFGGCQYFKEL